MTTNAPYSRRLDLRRLAIAGGLGVLLLYGLFVSTGYAWLHYVLKNDRIGFGDVALFRWQTVRKAMAVDQFAEGKRVWEAGNYQAAYLAFGSGVRNDPDNVDGRLLTASFLGAAGAINLEVNLLEDGLRRAPDDLRLIERTFAVLTTSGRDRHALDLLHKQYSSKLSGPKGPLLRTSEVLATLNADGAVAAKALLEKYPDLRKRSESAPVVARVLWETRERLAATELLAAYVETHPNVFTAFAQLAAWQAAGGMVDDAVQTAQRVCTQFPKDYAPRVLLIEMLGAAQALGSPPLQQAVEAYLKEFGGRPDAVVMLADLAGRKGWVALARTLYAVSGVRQPNLAALALFYSDALAQTSRLSDAQRILAEIEAQTDETNVNFLRLLRQRQVEVAAARGDHDGARDFARRLAAVTRSDADALEVLRRRFAEKRITEAVAELTSSPGTAKTPRAR
jgi:tetratricopeptide (TPR) repeat protein